MPRVTGLCGSSTVSHLAWCLRWMAAHSLVTMPVVSHIQKRKKWAGIGPRSSERCAWQRCSQIVTPAMVMCVSSSVYRTSSHHVACRTPLEKKSTNMFTRVWIASIAYL